MGWLDELDKRRGQVEITAENSARLAHAYGSATTTGQGTVQIEDRIDFQTAFVEMPYLSGDSLVDMDALADVLGLDPEVVDDIPLPHCSRFVVEWDQDDRDFYIGAWVAVKVSFDSLDGVATDAQPVITHHFTFSAIALKDIPLDASDKAATD